MRRKIILVALVLLVSMLGLVGCSKDSADPEGSDNKNPLNGTTWLRNDLAGEIVWGGKNQFRITFKNNSDFEILNIRNGEIKDLYHEGKYTFNGKTLTIPSKSRNGEEVKQIIYELTNSRTLALKKSDGSLSNSSYDNYIKQD